MKILYLLYNLVLFIILLLYMPVIIYKMLKGKYRKGFKQRLGFIPDNIVNKFRTQPTIWIHAVSVGETVAASSIVTEIKKKHPQYRILFSTITDTGQEMAHKIIEEADGFIYFPLDFSWVIRKVLRLIRPELVVIIETELWPNFIKKAKEFNSQIMLANGRISDKSADRYKYLGPLLTDMLNNVDIFSMQSEQDVEYILKLGAEKDRVYNSGNTKFDQTYAEPDPEAEEHIYHEFKINPEQPVLVVGSTHPDEEEQLIPVYNKLKANFPDLVMILAPRHIKRTADIESIYSREGVNTIRRTSIEKRDPDSDSVILLDTIGELAQIYSIADLVFIGGSLIERGGHNILEPAVHGKLVFFGPHMFNFKENTRLVLEHEVGIQVENTDELAVEMLYYLKNRDELQEKGRQALAMIEANKGASERNACLTSKLLDEDRSQE